LNEKVGDHFFQVRVAQSEW